jgi:hypothetical protein
MNKFEFVRGKNGNVIGSKTENTVTGMTIVRDRHVNVLFMDTLGGIKLASKAAI